MANTFVKLATASGGTTTFNFTSIPAGYKDLMLIGTVAHGFNPAYATADLRVNGTSGGTAYNYVSNMNFSSSSRTVGGESIPIEVIGTGGATNNELSPIVITFLNYSSTTTQKLVNWKTGVVTSTQSFSRSNQGWGWYTGTEAINRITWSSSSGTNWNNYSYVTLYGVAGS